MSTLNLVERKFITIKRLIDQVASIYIGVLMDPF